MKRTALPVLAVLALAILATASLACSFSYNFSLPRIITGPTQTFAVNEPAPATGVDVMDVSITMGAGKLGLQGGAIGLMEGQILYNVAEWTPVVTRGATSLSISQVSGKDNAGISNRDVIYDLSLKLGSTPMALTVNAGAYHGSMALGGVPLRSLTIQDGAADATLSFDSANPEQMDKLIYQTGASSVTLTGLANANAQVIEFSGGAGDYELDFSGQLQRDVTVDVEVGVSSLRLVVPVGTATQVNVSGGLNSVTTSGAWAQSGDIYSHSGTGHTITINVDMGVGSLELAAK